MSLLLERIESSEDRFDKGLDRLERLVKDMSEQFDGRVDQLEQFHLRLEEREKTLMVAREERASRRVRLSLRVGIGAGMLAFLSTAAGAIRGFLNWP